jgi:hypothetical protein
LAIELGLSLGRSGSFQRQSASAGHCAPARQNRQEYAAVDQVSDRSKTDTCAKRTLGSVVRIGALLMGAVLASVLMVELPTPAGLAAGGGGGTRPFVPASDTWIELGAPAQSRATPFPELQPDVLRKASAVDPAAVPSRDEERRVSRRKPRGAPLASMGRYAPRVASIAARSRPR